VDVEFKLPGADMSVAFAVVRFLVAHQLSALSYGDPEESGMPMTVREE